MAEQLHQPTSTATAEADTGTVPCVYCREPIPADSFTYWSARRLLSAGCPACLRRVTLPAAVWRRWRRAGTSAVNA